MSSNPEVSGYQNTDIETGSEEPRIPEQLDLEGVRQEYLEDAHEQSQIFSHMNLNIGNEHGTIPDQILRISQKKEKHVPVKNQDKELMFSIVNLYPTQEARQMIIDGMGVELEEIFKKFETPEMERISDLPNPERYPEYRELCKTRDQAQATIDYLKRLEVRIKEDAKLKEEREKDLLNDFDSRQYTFAVAGGFMEGSLNAVLPRMIRDIDFHEVPGHTFERREDDKKRILESYKDSIKSRYTTDELKIIAQLLRAHGRLSEANNLERII